MKKEQYKISVIVAVYNTEQYLEQCIDSILLQSYKDIELILVDDGSTDNSPAICDRYANEEDRVKVIHKKNEGPTFACVAGMAAAKGDYYMFVDSDDYVDTCMLMEMSKHLRGIEGEVVCCNHMVEKLRETLPAACAAAPGIYTGDRLQKEIKDRLFGYEERVVTASRCMKLCEKSIFEGNEKYYDPSVRLGDDSHMMYPALLNSRRVVIMKEAYFYHYRYVEDSIVHKYDRTAFDSVNVWYRSMERVIADKRTVNGEQRLRREYCYMLLYVMKNELRNPEKDYVQKIQKIFYDKAVRDCILNTRITVSTRANQLLYLGMRYPDKALLHLLRFILKTHDKKGK